MADLPAAPPGWIKYLLADLSNGCYWVRQPGQLTVDWVRQPGQLTGCGSQEVS
jgi:hypothetical protein